MSARPLSHLDETTRHRLLADEQRRFVIELLGTAKGHAGVTHDEFASDIDRVAGGTGEPGGEQRRNVRCRLHHVHLPMLDDAGVVAYDPETKCLRLGGRDAMATVSKF